MKRYLQKEICVKTLGLEIISELIDRFTSKRRKITVEYLVS